ncbi:UNVERIFIED_CONTAM: hypothetical protein NCL1_41169 [Trichonephila clavipes]
MICYRQRYKADLLLETERSRKQPPVDVDLYCQQNYELLKISNHAQNIFLYLPTFIQDPFNFLKELSVEYEVLQCLLLWNLAWVPEEIDV